MIRRTWKDKKVEEYYLNLFKEFNIPKEKKKAMGTFLNRITSRKFIIAGFAVAALVLSAAGVIDQPIEIEVAEAAGLSVYLFIQGLLDMVTRAK